MRCELNNGNIRNCRYTFGVFRWCQNRLHRSPHIQWKLSIYKTLPPETSPANSSISCDWSPTWCSKPKWFVSKVSQFIVDTQTEHSFWHGTNDQNFIQMCLNKKIFILGQSIYEFTEFWVSSIVRHLISLINCTAWRTTVPQRKVSQTAIMFVLTLLSSWLIDINYTFQVTCECILYSEFVIR